MPDDTDGFISVTEAASRLGVSERTIRRRIKDGEIQAASIQTPQGHIWRIDPASLPDHPALPPGTSDRRPADATRHDDDATRHSADNAGHNEDAIRHAADMPPGAADTHETLELVRLVDRLQRESADKAAELYAEIADLKGSAAHWQARALIAEEQARRAEEQVKLLMAPKDEPEPEPAPVDEARPRPWWQVWRR
jgi:excisionase family DNA binding protein